MTHILLSRGILGQPHILKHAAPFIHSNDKVAIVAFSFFPKDMLTEKAYDQTYLKGGTYYQKMVDAFLPYGIKEEQIMFLHYYRDDLNTLKKKLDQAQIIYFPGGSPDDMMDRLREKGLISMIKDQENKVIIGSSAGSMIQFDRYHISPDKDYHAFQYQEGLGLLSGFAIEVHYRRRKKQKAALRKVHRAKKYPIYAIPDDGALVIDNNQIKCINAFPLYNKKGIVRLKGGIL